MGDVTPYVDRLDPDELEALRPWMRTERHPAGTILFGQGDYPEHLHIVHQGAVKLVRSTEQGRDVILEILFPGDVCGALCALDTEPYGMSAVCLQEVEVSRVPRQQFMEAAERHPGVLAKAVDFCRQKTRLQREMMTGMAMERAEQRAARVLLAMAARLGSRCDGGVRVPMLLDRTEFSAIIGTTVETAIRVLSRLRKDQTIEEREGQVFLRDVQALRDLAGL